MDSRNELFRLGWNEDRRLQLEALGDPSLIPARVVAEHREAYALAGCGEPSARLSGRLRGEPGQWPSVGDWVAVRPAPGGGGIIHAVLPRHSLLTRLRPGTKRAQTLAANLDLVFVVTSPGQDFSLRRTERYLALVWASGARPVVVLNKADLSREANDLLARLSAVAPGAICLGTSAETGAGVAELGALLATGLTGALVGSSGVGKSSLLNRLLGQQLHHTAEVRLTDDKGRHTTTRRELVELPDGGCLIDTPGMRELGLWDAGEGLEETFSEIAELATGCRFRDCRHQGEPGCAVVAAVETGELAEDRLASLEKLRREEAFQERLRDPRSQAASKDRWKVIHKQHRARKRVDPKLRDD